MGQALIYLVFPKSDVKRRLSPLAHFLTLLLGVALACASVRTHELAWTLTVVFFLNVVARILIYLWKTRSIRR
jgi:hypothetical protein